MEVTGEAIGLVAGAAASGAAIAAFLGRFIGSRLEGRVKAIEDYVDEHKRTSADGFSKLQKTEVDIASLTANVKLLAETVGRIAGQQERLLENLARWMVQEQPHGR